jgi:hypothetical protein
MSLNYQSYPQCTAIFFSYKVIAEELDLKYLNRVYSGKFGSERNEVRQAIQNIT